MLPLCKRQIREAANEIQAPGWRPSLMHGIDSAVNILQRVCTPANLQKLLQDLPAVLVQDQCARYAPNACSAPHARVQNCKQHQDGSLSCVMKKAAQFIAPHQTPGHQH
jgi:hypothetical protein